jgi:propanediol dehydratase medium subunit
MAQITEEMVRSVVAEIVAQMVKNGNGAAPVSEEPVEQVQLKETGEATKGTNPNEVVIALPPLWRQTENAHHHRCSARQSVARSDGRH